MFNILISALFLCSLLCALEIGADCSYQNCICERTFTICKDRQSYNGAPSSTGITPPTIDLNQAKSLPGGVLPVNLTEIYLFDSPIMTIDENAFDDSANTVITLSISNGQLARIPDALLHLHALKYLTISYTNIQDWNTDVMTRIGPNVITCFLSNVGLNIWPAWMKSFANVTELSFEGSSVSSIPDDAFYLMNGLTSLSLNSNKLSAVPKALSQVTTLRSLDMDQNVISDITWLPKSSLLSSLSLSENKLSNSTALSNALHPFTTSLMEIDLHGNQLTSIPNLDFLAEVEGLDFSSNILTNTNAGRFPPKLDELDLSSNLFSSIPSFTLTLQFVPTLAMSSNYVTAIKDTDLPTCITYVQLDKNRITELTDTSFPQGSGILTLILDYNPLTKISASAFTNLASLDYLSLENSQLARLPLALASLTRLTRLDISGSRDLVCTCMEKSLEHWVTTLSAGSVVGDCGVTSIYVFFATLSTGCPRI